jgi:hypothetical protein
MNATIDDDVSVPALSFALGQVGLLIRNAPDGSLRILRGPMADAGEARVRALLEDFIEGARRNAD